MEGAAGGEIKNTNQSEQVKPRKIDRHGRQQEGWRNNQEEYDQIGNLADGCPASPPSGQEEPQRKRRHAERQEYPAQLLEKASHTGGAGGQKSEGNGSQSVLQRSRDNTNQQTTHDECDAER